MRTGLPQSFIALIQLCRFFQRWNTSQVLLLRGTAANVNSAWSIIQDEANLGLHKVNENKRWQLLTFYGWKSSGGVLWFFCKPMHYGHFHGWAAPENLQFLTRFSQVCASRANPSWVRSKVTERSSHGIGFTNAQLKFKLASTRFWLSLKWI